MTHARLAAPSEGAGFAVPLRRARPVTTPQPEGDRPALVHSCYLREVTGTDTTAKTFRTWIATSTASGHLALDLATRTGRPTKQAFLQAIDHAAERLGNTRSVCRSSSVHPAVEQTYLAGDFHDVWRSGPNRPTAGMTTAERRTLHLLRTAGGECASIEPAA